MGAIDPSRVAQLGRQCAKESGQKKDVERHMDANIGDDQASERIDEAKVLSENDQRENGELRRNDQTAEEEKVSRGASAEREAGADVRGATRAKHGEPHGKHEDGH